MLNMFRKGNIHITLINKTVEIMINSKIFIIKFFNIYFCIKRIFKQNFLWKEKNTPQMPAVALKKGSF